MADIIEVMNTLKHPVKYRMFLFFKLPAAFFSGVRIREINTSLCRVSIPYTWFSRNPFRSTYFACLAMAAEMSTGAPAMAIIRAVAPATSMLVVRMEAIYMKKARGRTYFVFDQVQAMTTAIREVAVSGEARVFEARSRGVDENGTDIAEFVITWSFYNRKPVL